MVNCSGKLGMVGDWPAVDTPLTWLAPKRKWCSSGVTAAFVEDAHSRANTASEKPIRTAMVSTQQSVEEKCAVGECAAVGVSEDFDDRMTKKCDDVKKM